MALFRQIYRPSVLLHPRVPLLISEAEAYSSVRYMSCTNKSCPITCQEWKRRPWFQCRHASGLSKAAKRLEKLGLGPDGKPLPVPNCKKIYPRMYKVLMINQDGSTYTIRHRSRYQHNDYTAITVLLFLILEITKEETRLKLKKFPHKIITLPLDLSTLTPQQLADREKLKQAATSRVYIEEDIDDEWEQDRYKHLLK